MHRLAFLVREDEPSVVPAFGRGLLVELAGGVSFEHCDGLNIQGDHSPSMGGLGLMDGDLTAFRNQSTPHAQPPRFKVDVLPAQS